jgi:uncharacterized membrane protein YccC
MAPLIRAGLVITLVAHPWAFVVGPSFWVIALSAPSA